MHSQAPGSTAHVGRRPPPDRPSPLGPRLPCLPRGDRLFRFCTQTMALQASPGCGCGSWAGGQAVGTRRYLQTETGTEALATHL